MAVTVTTTIAIDYYYNYYVSCCLIVVTIIVIISIGSSRRSAVVTIITIAIARKMELIVDRQLYTSVVSIYAYSAYTYYVLPIIYYM